MTTTTPTRTTISSLIKSTTASSSSESNKQQSSRINNNNNNNECKLVSRDGASLHFRKDLLAKVSSSFSLIFKLTSDHANSAILLPNFNSLGLSALQALVYNGRCLVTETQVKRIKAQFKPLNISTSIYDEAASRGPCSSGIMLRNDCNHEASTSYNVQSSGFNSPVNPSNQRKRSKVILVICEGPKEDTDSKQQSANNRQQAMESQLNINTSNCNHNKQHQRGHGNYSKSQAARINVASAHNQQIFPISMMRDDDESNLPVVSSSVNNYQGGINNQQEVKPKSRRKIWQNDMVTINWQQSAINKSHPMGKSRRDEIRRISAYIRTILPKGKWFPDGSNVTHRFQCFVCGRSIKTHQAWQNHVMGQHFHEKFDCFICNLQFKYFSALYQHNVAIHGNAKPC